jgi:hypothetical protein
VPSGDFYINTNSCGTNLILNVPNFPVAITTATTNTILVASNSSGLYQSQTLITYSTTYVYVAEPALCAGSSGSGTTTNTPGLYQGIGKIQFVQTSYDSLIGQFYQPITNTYAMHLIINSKLVNQTYQRVVTVPDFLMSAADLSSGGGSYPIGYGLYSRNVNLNQGDALPGLAGPGTIDPATTITFSKTGDIYGNVYQGDESTGGLSLLTWASFDGSTNDPVVYPNGTSIANLANQVLVQITPATLPNGTNNVSYTASFVATGGSFIPPFTWTIPSGGLPPGLTLSSTGVITGTPTQPGTFDFTLQLTDINARSVQWTYSLTIQ